MVLCVDKHHLPNTCHKCHNLGPSIYHKSSHINKSSHKNKNHKNRSHKNTIKNQKSIKNMIRNFSVHRKSLYLLTGVENITSPNTNLMKVLSHNSLLKSFMQLEDQTKESPETRIFRAKYNILAHNRIE